MKTEKPTPAQRKMLGMIAAEPRHRDNLVGGTLWVCFSRGWVHLLPVSSEPFDRKWHITEAGRAALEQSR